MSSLNKSHNIENHYVVQELGFPAWPLFAMSQILTLSYILAINTLKKVFLICPSLTSFCWVSPPGSYYKLLQSLIFPCTRYPSRSQVPSPWSASAVTFYLQLSPVCRPFWDSQLWYSFNSKKHLSGHRDVTLMNTCTPINLKEIAQSDKTSNEKQVVFSKILHSSVLLFEQEKKVWTESCSFLLWQKFFKKES